MPKLYLSEATWTSTGTCAVTRGPRPGRSRPARVLRAEARPVLWVVPPGNEGPCDGGGGNCPGPHVVLWGVAEAENGTSSTPVCRIPVITHGVCSCLTHSSKLAFLICIL